MNIRPFREIKRRKTKEINVGHIKVGGDNPISVQSMTNTLTKDVKETIKQIEQIGEAGAEGFGNILSGSLERSNVDITEELVNLITAQRNFQASAKAIETTTTLTQTIINIRG